MQIHLVKIVQYVQYPTIWNKSNSDYSFRLVLIFINSWTFRCPVYYSGFELLNCNGKIMYDRVEG